ncbi:MAG: hypothetical protein EA378_07220 [Phycisphaerales bacterium]|nr:MAG: hypothetical protein EA378_07220 [Phycisphaerales bacterium]
MAGVLVASVGLASVGSASEPDPMSGPSVQERSGAGERGLAPRGGRERASSAIPHAVFVRAVRAMVGPDVDEEVRLTGDQSASITEALHAHASAIRQHRIDRAPEYQALRAAMRPPGGRAWTPEEREAAAAARARLEALQNEAPSSERVHAAIREMLTGTQRAVLDAAVRAQLEQMREIREGVDGEGGEGRTLRDPRGGGGMRSISDAELAELEISEEVRETLRGLAPDERGAKLAELMVAEAMSARVRLLRRLRAIDGPVSDEALASMELPLGILERVEGMEPAQRQRALGRLLRQMEEGSPMDRMDGGGAARERGERPAPATRRDRRPD